MTAVVSCTYISCTLLCILFHNMYFAKIFETQDNDRVLCVRGLRFLMRYISKIKSYCISNILYVLAYCIGSIIFYSIYPVACHC